MTGTPIIQPRKYLPMTNIPIKEPRMFSTLSPQQVPLAEPAGEMPERIDGAIVLALTFMLWFSVPPLIILMSARG